MGVPPSSKLQRQIGLPVQLRSGHAAHTTLLGCRQHPSMFSVPDAGTFADGECRTHINVARMPRACLSRCIPCKALTPCATSAHTERWIWAILVSVVLYCPPNLYTRFSTYARGSKRPSPRLSFRPPYRRETASIVQHGFFHCCSRRIG